MLLDAHGSNHEMVHHATPHARTVEACMEIARYYSATWDEVQSQGRTRRVMRARCAIAVMLRGRGWSFPRIGALLNRDHTTIMSALKRAPFLLGTSANEQ